MKKIEELKTSLEIPVGYEEGEIEGRKFVVMFNTDETDKAIGKVNIVVEAETLDDAKEDFLKIIKVHLLWTEKRSHELNLWKPFQKGPWGHIGGSWLTIFGMHIYFRYGKGMKGGRYIPFTKLNISLSNYWRLKSAKT
jgi:hypothetical protein